MVRLITFATEDYSISAERLKATALRHGVDEVVIYTPDDLDPFFKENIVKPLMKETSRGYGFWVWKSYIILDAINKLKEGDILIYSDAGAELKDNIHHVIRAMDQSVFLCSNGWQNSHWMKREVQEAILPFHIDHAPSIERAFFAEKQCQASFIMFKVNDVSIKFAQEFLAWCMMPELIDNTTRGIQFEDFRESRHDQAILTALQIKYGYRKHWFPSSTGHHIPRNGDNYPEILWHHRHKNNEW